MNAPRSAHGIWNPGFIGNACLKNRLVRSAVNDALAAADGLCTPTHVSLAARLASGGVGAIVSGHMYVCPQGRAGNGQLGLDDDKKIPPLRELTDAVHEANGLIFAQLSHAGSQADIYLSGRPLSGPSARVQPGGAMIGALTRNDISDIIIAFAQAALRAKKAGFDGIQLHAAHGYCLSEFLSPAMNNRSDEYGGNVENRARLLREVCANVRDTVGDGFPLLVKINGEDFMENGMTRTMMRESIALLHAGKLLDAVEISGLWGRFRKRSSAVDGLKPETEAYVWEAALDLKTALPDLPVILVGGIRSLNAAKALLANGIADFVAMARPFIREPELVRRWWKQESQTACSLPTPQFG